MKLTYCVPYKGKWEEVEGELLPDIAPHLADIASWAVNRGAQDDRIWWLVTNLETGRYAAYDTERTHAIKKAAEKLATVTPDYMRRRIRWARNVNPTLYD